MAYTKQSDQELLQAALVGYQHQYAVLGERIAEITRQIGGRAGESAAADVARPRRMSASARRRIGEAQRKRWAAQREVTGTPAPAKVSGRRKKRNMSAEGKARIAEATRKRWEAFRAAKAAKAK